MRIAQLNSCIQGQTLHNVYMLSMQTWRINRHLFNIIHSRVYTDSLEFPQCPWDLHAQATVRETII